MKNKLQDLLSGMRVWATVAVLYVVVISGIPSAQAQSYKILFQFRAGVDEASPFGGLVSDPNGNLYGTTNIDGAFDSGVVFKLSPTGRETVLHSFSGSVGITSGAMRKSKHGLRRFAFERTTFSTFETTP
jgi:uncharacterized repeat protein (TIGR03803 family)